MQKVSPHALTLKKKVKEALILSPLVYKKKLSKFWGGNYPVFLTCLAIF